MKTRILLCLAILGLTHLAQAQFNIDWFAVAGGAGVSSGGTYSLSGTIGQADAGVMSGGNYSLTGGFWSIEAAAPISTPPTLSIELTVTNTVLISWPSPSTGFTLMQNGNLNTVSWVTAPETPLDNGTIKSVIVNPPTGTLFYRLQH
jgi:hypothetical protein